jgi:hypothetical protein
MRQDALQQLVPIGIRRRDGRAHGTRTAQVTRQRSRVDTIQRRDSRALEIVLQRPACTPVAVVARRFTHDEAGNLDRTALRVVRIDAVVADERIRHGDDLTGVGWVGENFLIARHGRVEHRLAQRHEFGTDHLAREGPAIFQQQVSRSVHAASRNPCN